MIRKQALREFLQRQRNDWRRFKKLTADEIEAKKNKLVVKPPIWKKLHLHQKVMFLLGVYMRRFGFFAATGTGKTLVSLAIVRYLMKRGIIKRILILVPNRPNKWEWSREIDKHSPSFKYIVLNGASTRKWSLFHDNPNASVIETYAGMSRMLCTKELIKKRGSKKLIPKLVPNKKLVREFAGAFDGLILDESTEVKNNQTLPYRICRQLSKHAKTVLALTGTPFGRDPIDLWSQLYLLDKGETLGETLGLYRAAFFKENENTWTGFPIWEFDDDKKALLNKFLANRTIRYKAKESDLPKCVQITKYVTLPKDAKQYYDEAKEQLKKARGNYLETKNAFLRARQISSGFLGFKDDETGAKAKFDFFPNTKLEALLALLATIEDKFIVFHDFIHSGDLISTELKKRKIGHVRLYGKTKNEQEVLYAFDKDHKVQGLLLASEAGAMGLNLQIAKYGIFYESPVPVITRQQCQGRFIRQYGVHKTVFMYDFVMQGTADLAILKWHAKGKSLFDGIIEGKAVL